MKLQFSSLLHYQLSCTCPTEKGEEDHVEQQIYINVYCPKSIHNSDIHPSLKFVLCLILHLSIFLLANLLFVEVVLHIMSASRQSHKNITNIFHLRFFFVISLWFEDKETINPLPVTILHFDIFKIYSCGKHCEKRRNSLKQVFYPI